MDLLEELTSLIKRFEKEGIEYALCGGLAMAVYAFPRATLDIDIMIEPEILEKTRSVASELGYSLDAGLMEFKKGMIKIYRMTKLIEESRDVLVLDMILVTPELKEVWIRKQRVKWENGELSVVSPEDLIYLKSLRNSGQDRDDIEHLRRILNED